ncbi:TetR/AcrR family transcriptional regulator [Limobrevibacterium gyesilva]|uniref:TetR/AcrR family transcriptional regulator n=1 Tax=Limobrevibacterium gyesilva TaxID=2991712 RepID=A0AA42CJ19_9PROT|nr:TetR/AcrR family transcriptional regulator [Limobrevibacterium gyesilva]MCW3476465.1 TetR/AcrR family transcriptional regulator [Limobrevibacterium gyesilva]
MRFSSDPPHTPRDSYHHGNLREALIETALRLIAERGPAGFAFAEVARAAGVSPAAPYRHFRDRNALMAEIARQGFERFADELEKAWDEGRPDPLAAIENCGKAYLAFARREPASYAAMFEPGLSVEEDAMLLRASERAFGVLRRAAEAACSTHRASGARPPPLMVALHIWAMSHGIASLFVGRSDAARRKLPMTPDDLLEAGLLIYMQSLGLTSGGA